MTTICKKCKHKKTMCYAIGPLCDDYIDHCTAVPPIKKTQNKVTGKIYTELAKCEDINNGNCPHFEEKEGFWYRLLG